MTDKASLTLLFLRCADLDRCRGFYASLGLSLIKEKHGTGPEHCACELGPLVFELYPAKDSRTDSDLMLGFRVPSLNLTLTSLNEIGTEILTPLSDSPRVRRAMVRDPDGRRVGLIES